MRTVKKHIPYGIAILNTNGESMKPFVIWQYGIKHIGSWTVFPWIKTDKDGWGFTWLFIFVSRFRITEDELDELGI